MSGRDDDGFLSRWSRRKVALRDGRAPGESDRAPDRAPSPVVAPTPPSHALPPAGKANASPAPPRTDRPAQDDAAARPESPPESPPEPPPGMEDVQSLTPASDFSRFTRPDVDPTVRNAALKKLFADARFNVIDEMDIDIMDYGKLEPLPASMLRRMTQAHVLGLFRDEAQAPAATGTSAPGKAPLADPGGTAPGHPAAAAPATPPDTPPPTHEDPDLRLQPDDAAGPAGDRPRAQDDAGRER